MIPQIVALKFAATPENILLAFVVLSIFAGCIWLQHQLEKRGQ